MLSYSVYKLVHLLGILILVGGLGSLWALASGVSAEGRRTARRWVLVTHGTAMFLILLGGFGMLARLGITGSWPLWIWIKISVWVLLGVLPVVLRRPEKPRVVLFFVIPLLGILAAWAAVFHPGQGS